MSIKINKESRLRKNITTLAIYNALFYENRKRQKALVSITIGDEKLKSLFELRSKLLAEIRKILKRVAYKGQKIAYFSNIEFGASKGVLSKEFNPHIHFQFFYDDFTPIDEALLSVDAIYNFDNADVVEANHEEAYFGYIVKEYLLDNYDEELEMNKMMLGQKKPLYTASRKSIPNYVIKFIYGYMTNNYDKWQEIPKKARYIFILDNIRDGNILINQSSKIKDKNYIKIKRYFVFINENLTN